MSELEILKIQQKNMGAAQKSILIAMCESPSNEITAKLQHVYHYLLSAQALCDSLMKDLEGAE